MMSESELTTILIIDNHSIDLRILLDLFSQKQVNLFWINPDKAAVSMEKLSLADLIFIAVSVLGENEYLLCQHLQSSGLNIPIVLITTSQNQETIKTGLSLGVIDYLFTCLETEEFLLKLNNYWKLAENRKEVRQSFNQLKQELETERRENLQLKNINYQLEIKVESQQEELQKSIIESENNQIALEQCFKKIKIIQTQLVNNEKMSILGQMLAGIAHEINNPVNFIYGNLAYVQEYTDNLLKIFELYQQYYSNPHPVIQQEVEAVELNFILEDLPKMLESMQVGAERIREIVLSLRNFARQDGSQMRATNLHEGIDSTLMILQNRLKRKQDHPAIHVIKEYSSSLPLVECYGGEMNQVFMNILANAIDAIEENNQQKNIEELQVNPGHILIKTDIINDHNVVIKISDNAGGMTEEILAHLFEPFFTTKPVGKGTGIGLSISKNIVVEKHKGSLQCISTPGKGTEFIIEIPITQEMPTQKHEYKKQVSILTQGN
ncbi:Response regulator receiver sensor signal transduction histidine kinase [Planktothrix sp. PCC 11201]|uniref:ATP-binding protein n=1 Tax=Planktothrix sp. PCC 11201 TaxID=1729650 RepID=UPI0009202591|nr:ATP-binding protein [Planktothrix sp. PCC 11201]SKB16073.1 Response regulator receiver sensor signal transduction histidine kinase [Planktothrix sp. PCC 11201]